MKVPLNRMMWFLIYVALSWTGVDCWVNKYDEAFTFKCPKGQFISGMYSVHNNYYEDRLYDFICSPPPVVGSLSGCFWTSDYVNKFDKVVNYKCPGSGLIAGMSSYHNNYYEDRRFKFYCCSNPTTVLKSCLTTDFQNSYDDPLEFTVPQGMVMNGIYSEQSNYYEDRVYKFYICTMVKQSRG